MAMITLHVATHSAFAKRLLAPKQQLLPEVAGSRPQFMKSSRRKKEIPLFKGLHLSLEHLLDQNAHFPSLRKPKAKQ
jgi:hypothetical protein